MKVPLVLYIHFLYWKVFSACHCQFNPYKEWMMTPESYTSYPEMKSVLTVNKNYSMTKKVWGKFNREREKAQQRSTSTLCPPYIRGLERSNMKQWIQQKVLKKKVTTCLVAEHLSMNSETSEATWMSIILTESCIFHGNLLKCHKIIPLSWTIW